jgi:hypothetical protein
MSELSRSVILGVALAVLAACGNQSPSSFGGMRGAGDGGGDGAHSRVDSGGPHSLTSDANRGAAKELAVTPATSMLTVTNVASPPSETLQAFATYADGAKVAVSASWTVDRPDIALVSAGGGTLTPTGTTFGLVTVTAAAAGLTATATVAVGFVGTLNLGGLTSAEQTTLTTATSADPTITSFVYPYDQTVFPRGLLPPEQMWNTTTVGDAYALHYNSPPYFDLTVFLGSPAVVPDAGAPSTARRFTLPTSTWNTLGCRSHFVAQFHTVA